MVSPEADDGAESGPELKEVALGDQEEETLNTEEPPRTKKDPAATLARGLTTIT